MVRRLLSMWNQERRAFLGLPKSWEVREVVYAVKDFRGTWTTTYNEDDAKRWNWAVEGTNLREPELVVKNLLAHE